MRAASLILAVLLSGCTTVTVTNPTFNYCNALSLVGMYEQGFTAEEVEAICDPESQ